MVQFFKFCVSSLGVRFVVLVLLVYHKWERDFHCSPKQPNIKVLVDESAGLLKFSSSLLSYEAEISS